MKAVAIINLAMSAVTMAAVTYSLVKGPMFDGSDRPAASRAVEGFLVVALYGALLTGSMISFASLMRTA